MSPFSLSKTRQRNSENEPEVDSGQYCTTHSQQVALSKTINTIKDYIAYVCLNANLRLDLPGKMNDMVSQSFDNLDKSNETICWHMFCKIDCLLRKTENLMIKKRVNHFCV